MEVINVPQFETARLILKGVTIEDGPCYQRHFVDYEVIRHLAAAVPWPYPEDGISKFILDSILPRQGIDRWVWGIFLKENVDELIGVVDLWREGKPENRGFWLGRKFWGRGIMTEAVTPVMDFAFNSLGFEKLVFSNALGNMGSHRVKEKTGATLIRVEPGKFVDSKYSQSEIWELTRENWIRRKTQGFSA